MEDNFKDKLDAYAKGKLPDNERLQLEKELDKLEIYQTYLDDLMKTEPKKVQSENRLINKGIWKARIQNAFTALSILLLVCFVSWLITTSFFTWGEPDRAEHYSEIIKTSVEVTHPNITVENSIQGGILKLSINGELMKQLGDSQKNIGELKSSFLFGLPAMDFPKQMNNAPFFMYPEQRKRFQIEDGFKKLDHLSEGTVADLYISLSDYKTTDETLKLLEGKEIHPVWFAVDTGFERDKIDFVDDAIGFPYSGFQLQKNEKIISKEKTGNWFHGTETIESENKGFAFYGDGPKRNAEFIDALDLMNSNTLISQNVLSKNRLKEKTKYIKENGVRIYGVVVTGPTKELLKLQNEEWVGKASVGDVDFWNWYESN